jgi:predicted RNA-binding Zn-ribbon protein involved in translation (DUF1610 family)
MSLVQDEQDRVTMSENAPEHAKTYPCPRCNAELVYSATKQRMVCHFCGYEAPVTEAGSMTSIHTRTAVDEAAVEVIQEHDLTEGLESAALESGWGTEIRTLRCNSCNAVTTVEPNVTATVCPFCGSHQVLVQEDSKHVIQPESLIPFQVDQRTAVRQFRTWLGKGWFRPNAVRRIARHAEAHLQGIYVPFWTFDANTWSTWHAEAGHYYQHTEHYSIMVDGKPQARTRQVQRVRWQPASGTRREAFDDVLVFATRSIDEHILAKIYPFDTGELVPYRPQYLAGWRAEAYQIGLQEAWKLGQEIISDRVRAACASEIPGDTYRNLRVQTRLQDTTFKHVLLPIWIASYRYRQKVYHFLVNGQTGKVKGEAPISPWKVALAVLIVLLLIAVVYGALLLVGQGLQSTGMHVPRIGPNLMVEPSVLLTLAQRMIT